MCPATQACTLSWTCARRVGASALKQKNGKFFNGSTDIFDHEHRVVKEAHVLGADFNV